MKNRKKNLIVRITAAVAVVVMSLGMFAACGNEDKLVYGKELVTLSSQLDTLTQLDAGTVDAAVIDSVMARYYAKTGAYAGKVAIMDGTLKSEMYGIAARKGDSAFMSEINKALIELAGNGKMNEIAEKFGLTADIAVNAESSDTYAGAEDSSWENIKTSGKIVIGYTVFAPIAFEEGGSLTGYDIELAKTLVGYLNEKYALELDVEFQVIKWDSKEVLLENGTIDLIWNGLTIDPERSEKMCISIPYLTNNQVAVVRKGDADKYKTFADLKDAIIGVEAGSAGEGVVRGK